VCLYFFIFGCRTQLEKRAFIDDSAQWKIIDECSYCYPIVDLLKSNIMTMRLEFHNDDQKGKFFIVKSHFINTSKPCKFIPSKIKAKLREGEILKQKAFACSYTIWETNYLRSHSPLKEPIMIEKEGCYLLFFDHSPLSINDELILDMKEAVIMDEKNVDIPLIYFKKKNKE
jgi:hypothetical protein